MPHHPWLYRSGFRARAQGNAGNNGKHKGQAFTGTTWNPSDKQANMVLSNGNLTADGSGYGGIAAVRGVAGKSSGKFYFEFTWTNDSSNNAGLTANVGLGIANGSAALNQPPGFLSQTALCLDGAGSIQYWNATLAGCGDGVRGDTFCVAVDVDNKRVWIRVNNGNWNENGTNNPATTTGGVRFGAGGDTAVTWTLPVYPYFITNTNLGKGTANFGSSAFLYAVPSGFTAGWSA